MRRIPTSIRLLLLSLIFVAGCTKSGFVADSGLIESGSKGNPNLDNGGPGAIQIQFVSLPKDLIAPDIFKVILTAEPLADLQELKLFVNNKEFFRFNRVPFEVSIDPNKFSECVMTLKAEALDKQKLLSYRTVVIKKNVSCAPTDPGSPLPNTPPSSKSAGTLDPNCLTNNAYDACLFWKNPVAQKGSAYASPIRFGQDLNEQTFGVKLAGLTTSGKLENDSISVWSSDAPTAVPQGGNWRYAYQDDSSHHFIAQLMAYFWLTYQKDQMVARTGNFFASDKAISVDAYSTQISNNAYWDSRAGRIVMGVATNNGSLAHEMALSAEVYLHEMGHANLQFASGQFLFDYNSNQSGNSCTSQDGCMGAINEGQADFHIAMILYESTAVGETFVNSVNGMSQFGLSRDVRKLSAVSVSEFYSRSKGEVHGMGSFYASVLWEIYNDPKMLKADFEKIFSAHLQKLTASSRFQEARDILIAEDLALYSGKYKTLILNAFAAKGIQ